MQNPSYIERLKSYFRQKHPVQAKKIEQFWNTHSGDWHWLAEKPIPIASLNRDLWTIGISWLTAVIVSLKTVGPEILARSNPTLIDLGIALAAGAAGAFANSRRRIADAYRVWRSPSRSYRL